MNEGRTNCDYYKRNISVVICDREIYPWSFVTEIFRTGLQNHGGDQKKL
jgi:hypothetical protein